MSWNCAQIEERLTDYLDGLLTADERTAFEAHAESCAKCPALVSSVRGLVAGMQRIEMIEPSQGLIYRILAETTGKLEKPARQPGSSWFPAFLQPKLVLGALSVVATFGILLQATGIDLRKVSKTDLNPMTMVRATNRRAHLTYARGIKFVNDLRVVYEIQLGLQGLSAAEPTPAPQRRDQSSRPAGSGGDRPLKNYYEQGRVASMCAGIVASLPGGFPR